MNRRTLGMSIIEISIALTISSFLMLALYQSFNTAEKNSQSISATMNAENAFAIAYNQLDKDFSALFIPERVFNELQKKEPKEEEKNKKEPFKDIFTPILKEKDLESITFLSTHSLPLFNSKSPYAVRIAYKLIKQDNNEWYALVRQESTKLDLLPEQFKEKNIPAYQLIQNIKSLSITFTVIEKEKKESSSKDSDSTQTSMNKTAAEPKKYVVLTTWPQSKDVKKPDYLIPAFITLKGIFVDEITRHEYDFEWIFPVPVYDDVMQRLANFDKKHEKKIEQKNDTEKKEKSSENKKETVFDKNQKQTTQNKQTNQKTNNIKFALNIPVNKK